MSAFKNKNRTHRISKHVNRMDKNNLILWWKISEIKWNLETLKFYFKVIISK